MSTRLLAGALLAAGLTITGAAGAGAASDAMPSGAAVKAMPSGPAGSSAAPAMSAGEQRANGAWFRDAFNFKAPAWRGVVGKWSVRNGTLFNQGMPGRFSSVAHINNYDDFDYEVRMNRVGNSNGAAPNCLIIRGNPNRVVEDLWLPGYYFCYSNNGKAQVVAIDKFGRVQELEQWKSVPEIGNGGGYRTVRVQAYDSYFYFSVNGKDIGSYRHEGSPFGQVGAGYYVEPGKRGSLALDYANLGPLKA